MDLLYSLVFIHLLFLNTEGRFKRWLPNTNFGNPYNWDTGKIPCGDNIAVISDDSPTVYLQTNTTIKELRLPTTDITVILDENFALGFTDVADNNPECLSNGQVINFNKTYPSDWFDPKNWCTSETETGNCTDIVLESEMVPCSYDDVVFPKDNSFFVNVESGVEIEVNTLKITGKAQSTTTFSSFLNTDIGSRMFPKPHTGDRSRIKILRRSCVNPIGCSCGNDKPEILRRICNLQKPYCVKPSCKNPIIPTGACCEICGAKMTAEYGTGFKFDTLKNGLQRNFIDGKEQFKGVQFVVSRTSNDKIQIILTDRHGGVDSVNLASLMKTEIDRDISTGGFKYSLRKIAIELSGPPTHSPGTAARTGGNGSKNGGKTAGIVIAVLVVIGAVLVGLGLIYKRKRGNTEVSKFKMFDRISFRRKIKRPRVEVSPFFGIKFRSEPDNIDATHQGFDNPMYGNMSLENEKPMDLELMPPRLESEEQPTFDTSGFDNPLYDTYVQESPFSDPTIVESDKSSREIAGLPEADRDSRQSTK